MLLVAAVVVVSLIMIVRYFVRIQMLLLAGVIIFRTKADIKRFQQKMRAHIFKFYHRKYCIKARFENLLNFVSQEPLDSISPKNSSTRHVGSGTSDLHLMSQTANL